MIAFIFGWLLMIQNVGTLFLSRIGQGICVGLYSSIVPMIVKELSPTEIAGTLGAFNQFFIIVGVVFSYLLYFLFHQNSDDENSYWFFVFGFTLLTIVIQTLTLLFLFPY